MKGNFRWGHLTKLSTISILMFLAITPVIVFVTHATKNFWTFQIKPKLEVHQIKIKFNSIYSNKIKQELLQAVSQNFNEPCFYEKIKDNFKIIKNIEWHRSDIGCVNMTITGIEPFCKINNKYVLGNKHRLFEFDQLENCNLEHLPNIQLSEKMIHQKLDDQAYNFIRGISEATWKSFEINYLSQSNIELSPRYALCKSLVVVDEISFFNGKKLEMISAVFSDLTHKGFISEKVWNAKTHKLVFDLRGDNRILVKIFDSFNKRGMGR